MAFDLLQGHGRESGGVDFSLVSVTEGKITQREHTRFVHNASPVDGVTQLADIAPPALGL